MDGVFTVRRPVVLLPLALLIVGLLAAAMPSSSGAVTCKLKSNNKVKCPTKKLKGPEGPAGPVGPTGPEGPGLTPEAGAPTLHRFSFLATGSTPNTVIQTFNGAVAEAGCASSTFQTPRLRATANDGFAEVLNTRTKTFSFDPDLDGSQTVDLLAGGGADDQYTLKYMSAGGAQQATASYTAADGVGVGGQFDCVIFGFSTIG